MPAYADAVDSIHFVYDESVGFSAMMKMFDRDPKAKLAERMWSGNTKWTMWAPMLALQSPDPAVGFPQGTTLQPYIFLHNTTNQPIQADLSLNWHGESTKGRVAVPKITLQPHETKRLDIAALQKPLGIPDDAHWALVKLTGSATPDEFIAVAASYDHTGRYGAQTPFSDQLSEHWVGGQWLVDATHNSITAIGNGGDQPTDALLTLHFNDGRDAYEIQQTIAPGDQMWLNFADLIHNQVPDRKGKTLPLTLTSGTYDIRDLSFGHGGRLFEGKVILDKTWGHLAYGCVECCNYQSVGLLANPTFVGIGGTSPLDASGTDTCTDYTENLDGYFRSGTWWSGNAGIATVQTLQTSGVGAGGTMAYGRADLPSQAPRMCPRQPQQAQAPVNVQIPDHFIVLSDTTATLNCSGPPGNSTKQRQIQYEVDDANDNQILFAGSYREQFTNLSGNSCGNPIHTTQTCTVTPLGQVTDGITPACGPTPAQCGFTAANQVWQYCAPGGATPEVADPGALQVYNTYISVGGNLIGFLPGHVVPK